MNRLARDRFAPLTRAQTLAALKEFARQIGRTPMMADVAAVTQVERGIRKHFGSLAPARKAAGLLMAPPTRKWTEAKVIAELRRLHQLGAKLSRPALAASRRYDLLGAIALRGGIQVMRRRAGVPEPKRPRTVRTRWDDARVLDEIRQRHDDGEPLAYTKVPAALIIQGWKRFGSWRNAVTAAGLDYDQVCLLRRWCSVPSKSRHSRARESGCASRRVSGAVSSLRAGDRSCPSGQRRPRGAVLVRGRNLALRSALVGASRARAALRQRESRAWRGARRDARPGSAS